MKSRKWGELILALIFLAFFVTMLLISMTYSPMARRMPMVVILPGLAMTVVLVIKEAVGRRSPQAKEPGQPEQGEAPEIRKMLLMFGWMGLLVGMIWIFGFLLTIPVYTLLFMRSMRESWRTVIVFAAVGFILLYGIFVFGLNMELYPGLIFRH